MDASCGQPSVRFAPRKKLVRRIRAFGMNSAPGAGNRPLLGPTQASVIPSNGTGLV